MYVISRIEALSKGAPPKQNETSGGRNRLNVDNPTKTPVGQPIHPSSTGHGPKQIPSLVFVFVLVFLQWKWYGLMVI